MSNINIFRANRGEGKTKWLADKVKECADSGLDVYYIGWDETFKHVKRVYEAMYSEKCPLKYHVHVEMNENTCFFTDELFANMAAVLPYKPHIVECGYKWFVTMSKEDFVN